MPLRRQAHQALAVEHVPTALVRQPPDINDPVRVTHGLRGSGTSRTYWEAWLARKDPERARMRLLLMSPGELIAEPAPLPPRKLEGADKNESLELFETGSVPCA